MLQYYRLVQTPRLFPLHGQAGPKIGLPYFFEKQSSEELPWKQRIRCEVQQVAGNELILPGM